MTFEKAIHSTLGVQFRLVPDDGKLRRFAIGKDEGFAIQFTGCGAFGNWSTNNYYSWDGDKVRQIESPSVPPRRLNQKELREEEMIVAVGNAASDSGAPLVGADLDRYILALTRVIDNKARYSEARG